MFSPLVQGFFTGGSLIVAIGAQNAFVLSQSVKRNHHLTVAWLCILSDMALIGLGVSSVGTAVAQDPVLIRGAAWLGAAFLGWYGYGAFRGAVGQHALETNEHTVYTLRSAVLAALAVTYLNPHVYLDTIVLMGAVSGQFSPDGRFLFWAGAATASTCWFLLLAIAGQTLAPYFRRPEAWRILDGCVCLTMWGLTIKLVYDALT